MLSSNNLFLPSPILTGLSVTQRTRPFVPLFLQCTFCQMHQHQFVCDPIVTTNTLSRYILTVPDEQTTEKHKMESEGKHPLQPVSSPSPIPTTPSPPPPPSCGSTLLKSIIQNVRSESFVMVASVCNPIIRTLLHPYLLLTYLSFVAYWPSLWAGFVFDDRPAIIENKDLRPDVPWNRIWFDDYWGTTLKSSFSHKSYRPLTVLTFRLNYLFHGLQPFTYHLVNLFLHVAVSILFYRFCLLFFHENGSNESIRQSIPPSSPSDSKQTRQISHQQYHNHHVTHSRRIVKNDCVEQGFSQYQSTSFLVSTLFTVHPIHTDCVSSVVGRAELLSALFYLLSILAWNKGNNNNWTNTGMRCKSASVSDKKNILVSIMMAIIGFLCKEQSIFVLIYLAFCELCRTKCTTISVCDRLTSRINLSPINRRHRSSPRLAIIGTLAISFTVAIYTRFALMDFTFPSFNRFDNPAFHSTFPTKQLTYAYLALYHFWLVLFPMQLSCDWTHVSIELIDFSPQHFYLDLFRLVVTLCVLSTMVICTIGLLWNVFGAHIPTRMLMTASKARTTCHKWKTNLSSQKTLHALLLTIAPFVPASNLFFPAGFVIAERVLYLPSMGFLLLIGLGMRHICNKSDCEQCTDHHNDKVNHFTQLNKDRHTPGKSNLDCLIRLLVIAMVVVFTRKTFDRSRDWRDEYSLYESGLTVNPRNTKLLNNLGRLHEKDNRVGMAISLYQKAISIEPKDIRSYLNLGNALMNINDKVSAEKVYREALAHIENETFQHSNRRNLGKWEGHQRISPLYFTALIRLTELIEEDPLRESELKELRKKMIALESLMSDSVRVKSHQTRRNELLDSLTKNGYMNTYLATSCGSKCQIEFARSLEHEDSHKLDHLYNIGVVHYKQGHLQEALIYFEKVLSINPYHEGSLLASARIIQDEDIQQLNNVAFDRLNQLVRLGRGDEFVHFNLAMLAVKAGKYPQAKKLFEEAIFIRKSFAEAHYNLALLLIKGFDQLEEKSHSNLVQAVHHLKNVLEINPNHLKSMLVLGDLYAEGLYQLDVSQHYYQMVVDKVDFYNVRARNNLCVLHYKKGHSATALECFQILKNDILKVNPNDEQTLNLVNEQIKVLVKAQPPNSEEIVDDKLPQSKSTSNQNQSFEIGQKEESNQSFRHLMISSQFAEMCFI